MADTWDTVLTRLEADLTVLESQLSGIPDALDLAALGGQPAIFTPPSGLGPLPAHLADRARALEAAQARVALRLEEIRTTAGQHLAALRAVPSAPAHPPVYVDVEG
ncbi:MAG TPA: hypothetical protein VFM07_10545 [Intrasporangium sp.]|nr:hypothetical protein [Intrasporangium sp.]